MLPLITASKIIQFLPQHYSPEQKPSSLPGMVGGSGSCHLPCGLFRGSGSALEKGLRRLMGNDVQGTVVLQNIPFLTTKNSQTPFNSNNEFRPPKEFTHSMIFESLL